MARQDKGSTVTDGTPSDPIQDDSSSTLYESIEGLNLNLSDPDSECDNSTDRNEFSSMTEFEGSVGTEGEFNDSTQPIDDSTFLLDAIHGSYDLPSDPEVIIGRDDRIRINPTNVYPWRAICALKITAANGRRFIGTGWFVSARTVITAGHCIYMHNAGGWVRSVEVIPGLNDSNRPYGSATSSQFRSVTGWTQSRNRNHDYGAIILPQNARLGDRTGVFGIANRPDSFIRSARLNLSGYPGDKGGNQQWFMAERAKSVTPRTIVYEIDTFGGQSGAPVWVLQGGKRYALGIHTNGHSTGNSATRIETNVANRIAAWRTLGS